MVRQPARGVPRYPRRSAPSRCSATRYTLDTVRAIGRPSEGAFRRADGRRHPVSSSIGRNWRQLFSAIPIAAFARPGWSYPALSLRRRHARLPVGRMDAGQGARRPSPSAADLGASSRAARRAIRRRRSRADASGGGQSERTDHLPPRPSASFRPEQAIDDAARAGAPFTRRRQRPRTSSSSTWPASRPSPTTW